MFKEQQQVSGLLVKRSYLLNDTKLLVVDIDEVPSEIPCKLGQAEVAHQVRKEV
jgi:hypothetical protein